MKNLTILFVTAAIIAICTGCYADQTSDDEVLLSLVPSIRKQGTQEDPSVVMSMIARHVRLNNIDAVLNHVVQMKKTKEVLKKLPAAQRYKLAFWLENAKLTYDWGKYKVYKYSWKEAGGKEAFVEFHMTIDDDGVWKLAGW